MKIAHALVLAAVLLVPSSMLWHAADGVATPPQSHEDYLRENYDKTEHMVPMRDGVQLYTIVYAPKDDTKEYPVMLFRTPYSIRPYEADRFRTPLGPTAEFDREGYIFVFQDVRGKFRSEGEFEVIKPLARDRPGSPETDESTDITAAVERHTTTARNVVGLIRGGDPDLRAELVIVCAHHDHNGADGEDIFNGADDDGSGIVGLLEIAEAYAAAVRDGRRPRRSVLFAAWDAEERGLLGAWYHTEQPYAPLEDVAAVLNMDMIGRNEEVPENGGGRFRGLEVQSAESNANAINILGHTFSTDLIAAAEAANGVHGLELELDYDNNTSNLLRRSDQWPFLQRGVPALFFHTGLHPTYHTRRWRRLSLEQPHPQALRLQQVSRTHPIGSSTRRWRRLSDWFTGRAGALPTPTASRCMIATAGALTAGSHERKHDLRAYLRPPGHAGHRGGDPRGESSRAVGRPDRPRDTECAHDASGDLLPGPGHLGGAAKGTGQVVRRTGRASQ